MYCTVLRPVPGPKDYTVKQLEAKVINRPTLTQCRRKARLAIIKKCFEPPTGSNTMPVKTPLVQTRAGWQQRCILAVQA
jgi:hypothetical protein